MRFRVNGGLFFGLLNANVRYREAKTEVHGGWHGGGERKGCFGGYRRFSGSGLFEDEKSTGIKVRPGKQKKRKIPEYTLILLPSDLLIILFSSVYIYEDLG